MLNHVILCFFFSGFCFLHQYWIQFRAIYSRCVRALVGRQIRAKTCREESSSTSFSDLLIFCACINVLYLMANKVILMKLMNNCFLPLCLAQATLVLLCRATAANSPRRRKRVRPACVSVAPGVPGASGPSHHHIVPRAIKSLV